MQYPDFFDDVENIVLKDGYLIFLVPLQMVL
jgi:hypothetical protein